jgi:hypothetical protein
MEVEHNGFLEVKLTDYGQVVVSLLLYFNNPDNESPTARAEWEADQQLMGERRAYKLSFTKLGL